MLDPNIKTTGEFTDVTRGLEHTEVVQRRRKYGSNELETVKRRSFFSKFVSNLGDPIIKILIGALIINTALNFKNINWPESVGILCAILIATLVSTVSEQGSEAAFEKLKESAGAAKVFVKRDGRIKEIPSSDVVAGDICYVRAGMRIPADCVITDGAISVNEAPLTGESKEIKKRAALFSGGTVFLNDARQTGGESKIYKGCLCTSGECAALTVAVGSHTEYGKIARNISVSDRKSPLKERLGELAKSVSILGYIAAALIITMYLFNAFIIDSGFDRYIIAERLRDVKYIFSSFVSAVTLGVSALVVAVPEGLPMMITVVLSSNMKRMLKSGVLVRKMVGIETAGSMNILFTDKTGTLTSGNMTVNRIYIGDGCFTDAKAATAANKEAAALASEYLIGAASKTPTEKAISSFFKGSGDIGGIHCIEKMNFDPAVKYSACLYGISGTEKCAVLGAAEKILSASVSYKDEFGRVCKMDKSAYYRFAGIIGKETSSCARVLALATLPFSEWRNVLRGEICGATLVSLVSIRDELRPEIKKSVATAKNAGIHVVMITGDNKDTAYSIAKEAGIVDAEHDLILSGDEVADVEVDRLKALLPRLAVVSRATPSDKLKLVECATESGLVSGMTGDGINDAPSLKAADVGFAMGSGSDVAKEASDVILTNNSFKSITNAILYGRCVFESIKKFITFQLMMNLCALGVCLIGPAVGIESPITVIQMLWVNIIMDTLGGLAFSGEIPLREYMTRPPVKRNEKILTKRMVGQILYLGLYTLTLSILFLKLPAVRTILSKDDDLYHLTCFFALFIFCGIFNSFNSRSPSGKLLSHISGNKAFIFIIAFVAVVQIAIIYTGGSVFRCVPITAKDLAICAAAAFTVIPADMIRKSFITFIKRKERR